MLVVVVAGCKLEPDRRGFWERERAVDMNRTPTGTSIFSGARGFFQSRPAKVKKRSARKSSGQILLKKNRQANRANIACFRAAEIEFEDCACDAVKTLQGRRFLVSEVPRIPVPDCDKTNCQCSYVRYSDRRLWSEDRRAFFGLNTSHYIQGDSKERRKLQDRRADQNSAGAASDSFDEFESWFK